MNEIQVFSNEQFGQVRTVTVNGEPWFVLKDVCAVFGENNYRRVAERIDDEEKGVSQIETLGGKQSMTIINESGVYSALFAMQPTKARGVSEEYIAERQRKVKQFKKWVTHEVLPSIRKHGAYIVGQESMTREQLIAQALVAANDIIAERDKQINQLNETVAIMEPKASYYDKVLACKDLVPITIIAKDYGMSAVEMNKWLHDNGYQYKRNKTWVLYDKYADKGYTSSKTHTYEDTYGRTHSQMQTQWTQTGRLFLYQELKKNGILPKIEQETIQERM